MWVRETGSVDAPARARDLALPAVRDGCWKLAGDGGAHSAAFHIVFEQALLLHLTVSKDLLRGKITPYAGNEFALPAAVSSCSAVDVNMALDDFLGRVDRHGLWQRCGARFAVCREGSGEVLAPRDRSLDTAIRMVRSDPGLLSPVEGDFAIEIALFMMLAHVSGRAGDDFGFFAAMARKLTHSDSRPRRASHHKPQLPRSRGPPV